MATPPCVDELDVRARMASLRSEMFGVSVEPPHVDRFRIIDRLGGGGMGVVYAAFDPRLNRRVALKLVRPDMTAPSHQGSARLLREAQAMARLSHPNVVQIHEVGLWEGRVFIAMELVVGRSLAGWLEWRLRDWREVVRVFIEAGRGLAAAHAVGIVHRDFKPANVLVGDDGRIRVTDFGLARGVLDGEPAAPVVDAKDPMAALTGASATAVGARAGTPEYMSPEQFIGRTATAASDQFSFCVALHRALHGARPFAGESREALARAVLAGELQAPPRLRIPRRIHRALVRGLAREPTARFPGMPALLAALAARSPWRALVPAALFFAAGLGASALALRVEPCSDDGGLLAGAWDPAIRAAAERRFLDSGLTDAPVLWASASRIFDDYAAAAAHTYVQSCEAAHRGESSRELHDLRAACLHRQMTVVRGITGAILDGTRDALRNATQAAGQLGDLGGCDDRRALLLGTDPPPASQLGELTRLRATIDEARSLELLGDTRASAALITAALADARRLGHAPDLAEALFLDGRLKLNARDFRQAEDALRQSHELAIGARHDALIGDLWTWRIVASVRRRNEASGVDEWLGLADAWLDRADPSPLQQASLERARSIVLQIAGDHAAAEAASRRAIARREQVLGPDHLEVAIERYNHANSLSLLGRHDEAIEGHERALAVMRANIGDEHALTADVHYNLGVALMRLGTEEALARAADELQRSRTIMAAVRGAEAPELATSALALARVAHLHGDLDGAERWIAAAEANHAQHPGRPERALVLAFRGSIEYERDRLEAALAAHTEARELALAAWGPICDLVGAADSNIADILQARGDLGGALRRYDEALFVLGHVFGPEAVELVPPLLGRSEVLVALDRSCDAVEVLDRALALLEQREVDAAMLDEARGMRRDAAVRCEQTATRRGAAPRRQ